ncbi:MAG: NAD(P)-dependent alcohol dehydrogenase [Pseudomonadota bacterium]
MTGEPTTPTPSFAVYSAGTDLRPMAIERRLPRPRDVQIEIDFCGVCHTDLHYARNDWGNAVFPVVPGHEIVGHVTALGNDVTDLDVGQRAAVGCFVDSCRTCDACKSQLESYCTQGLVMTYNTPCNDPGGITYGGYSKRIVVDRDFVLTVPAGLDSAGTAPLLCAGITTYSPLREWQAGPGQRVGVIGLGGLGHMAIKIAAAMGARVTLISRSTQKASDAKRLGASDILISTDAEAMDRGKESFDLILNTIPVPHDFNPYMSLLRLDGTMCILGAVGPEASLDSSPLIMQRRRIAGSFVGGLAETQEMLDFCGSHGIVSDIEMISMVEINDAFVRLRKSDVKYRFVIDMATLSD